MLVDNVVSIKYVSTHSRPKAADLKMMPYHRLFVVSTHSRPKAAD